MQGGGFDTHTGILTSSTSSQNASTFQLSNVYFSPVSSSDYALNLSAPAVKAYITNSSFFTVFSLTNPPVRLSGTSAELQISNSDFQSQGIDMTNVSQTAGSLILLEISSTVTIAGLIRMPSSTSTVGGSRPWATGWKITARLPESSSISSRTDTIG